MNEVPVPLSITFDLEDNRSSALQEARFVRMSHLFLEFLGEHGITATVFIVGEIARTYPDLVRRVAEDGHEIGLHGLRHVALADVGKMSLPRELHEGRALLEEVAQVAVQGFRAPIFSLTPDTRWAVQQIGEAGFTYSSSVLPAANPLHGWPNAPRRPWRWDNGLVELPCPVGGMGRLQIPFLGGIYLRYVPVPLIRSFLDRLDREAVVWSYLHPYDLDLAEPFFVMPHAGWLTSRIVHSRRHLTLTRLEAVLAAADGPGPTLGEVLRGLNPQQLPVMRAGI
jgi:polysaccharide deacetylase family protein (PEP-CTERM system associated)